jgi:hypothetical protein
MPANLIVMKKYILYILLFVTVNSFAQHSITGKVIDQANNKPISSAVVFLNKTGIATNTAYDGSFILKNVPEGHYQLLVTLIGYEGEKLLINVTGDTHLPDISIAAKSEYLKEVVVKDKIHLSPFYYAFRAAFLGSNLFAKQCKILNPEVIHYYNTDKKGDFSARSESFIKIENDALGYKINVMLTSFTETNNPDSTAYSGNSYYEEMKGTDKEERTWKENRMECYQGSIMQFLRAVLAGTAKQEGYKIKKATIDKNAYYDPIEIYDDMIDDPFLYKIKDSLVKEQDIVARTDKPGLFALTKDAKAKDGCLYVEFHEPARVKADGKKSPRIPWIWQGTNCFILFDKPYAIFDYHGTIAETGDIKFFGFFGQEYISNQLPSDFDPSEQQL